MNTLTTKGPDRWESYHIEFSKNKFWKYMYYIIFSKQAHENVKWLRIRTPNSPQGERNRLIGTEPCIISFYAWLVLSLAWWIILPCYTIVTLRSLSKIVKVEVFIPMGSFISNSHESGIKTIENWVINTLGLKY